MIVMKFFAAGENRETRIEEALYRFLFPGEPGQKRDSAGTSRKEEPVPDRRQGQYPDNRESGPGG